MAPAGFQRAEVLPLNGNYIEVNNALMHCMHINDSNMNMK